VLIYAYSTDVPQHRPARTWLETAFKEREAVRIPWAVISGFLRLMTGNRLLTKPLSADEVCVVIDDWLATSNVAVLDPGPGYWPIMKALMRATNARGDRLSDLHIAALALENDAAVCTTDRDFDRFPGLRVINPLV
jgi:hypothetical protein